MGQTEHIDLPSLLIFGILGMLLLAMAIIVFFVIYQKRIMAQQEKMLLIKTNYQKELLNATLQIQEIERKRIASDLHDSIGGMLSATKLYIKQLQNINNTEKLAQIKKESLYLIDNIILNVRSITHNLAPLSLERFGLVPALEDLCEHINELGLTEVLFQANQPHRFSGDKEVHCYRILQELINNSLKHAQAAQIHIRCSFKDNTLKITYLDDGVGFDMTKLKNSTNKGLGLRNIESRVNYLDADFNIQTMKGQGVHVSIRIKL